MKSGNYICHDIIDHSQRKGNNQERSKSSSKDSCSYGSSGGYVEHDIIDYNRNSNNTGTNKKNRK